MPESIYAHRLFEGIFTQCHKYGYDVAVFSSMLPVCSNHKEYLEGEINIYELIDFNKFDGVIVDTVSITEDQTIFLKELLLEKLQKECKKPVISLYLPLGDYPVERCNDSEMIKCITEHVIVHHGCKDIYFLSGMKGYPVSLEREESFRKTLEEHNIPFDDSRIFYGDFWYSGGNALAEKIASGEVPRPEAVVCASDHMAIGLVKSLMKNGIRVPQDIIVTGFDATQEAALSETSVTSCESNAQQAAANAIDKLVGIIEPEREIIPYEMDTKKVIHEGMSCGCQPDFLHSTRKFKESFYFKNVDFTDENSLHDINIGLLMEGYLAERQMEANSPEECLQAIHRDTYYLRPYKNFYMCLREDWLTPTNIMEKGYPERMKLSVQASDVENSGFCRENDAIVFDTELMLPALWKDRKEPSVFYFAPLHFKEKPYGYVALECDLLQKKKLNVVHRNWLRFINNSLEMISTRYRLTAASVRDEMTGAYNRRGMNKKLDEMLKSACADDVLYVYVIDMDGLKGINDTYGHTDGDYSITAVCSAAQSITDSDSICIRAGGDEFYVIGIGRSGKATDRSAEFNETLKNISDKSKKPYQITASIGYCSAPMSEKPDIDKLISEADISMYIVKSAKKKRLVGLK
jgi:diguanylate cyclase (GGDEF)-like protein